MTTLEIQSGERTSIYMNVEINTTQGNRGAWWHSATLPNGRQVSSNCRKHVTKKIKKYFNDDNYRNL